MNTMSSDSETITLPKDVFQAITTLQKAIGDYSHILDNPDSFGETLKSIKDHSVSYPLTSNPLLIVEHVYEDDNGSCEFGEIVKMSVWVIAVAVKLELYYFDIFGDQTEQDFNIDDVSVRVSQYKEELVYDQAHLEPINTMDFLKDTFYHPTTTLDELISTIENWMEEYGELRAHEFYEKYFEEVVERVKKLIADES